MPAHDSGASTRKPPAAILSLPDLINHARARTHARALMQTHACARARTHIHAHALTHTHTYRHIHIYIGRERDTRAHGQSRSRFDRSTRDSCLILSLSRNRVVQRRRAVPASSSRPPELGVCGMGLNPSLRMGLRSVVRERQRGAIQVGRTRRAAPDVGARLCATHRLFGDCCE